MNILSFDIEEWFHILDNDATKSEVDWANFPERIYQNMDLIHELLGNQKATFFCIGWVARKYHDVIKRIAAAGYEIATHSDLHQLAYEQSHRVFNEDLSRSIQHLEALTGKKVKAYRAPGFSIMEENKWVFESLINHGIEIDCSVFPAKRAHGGFENFGTAEPCWIDIDGHKLKEFPINLEVIGGKPMIFSGGGYFRLLPYAVLNHFFKKSDYVMTYFHPRDFDAQQPMVPGLNAFRKFKSYYGLAHTKGKLEKLIKNHNFVDLKTADSQIDWSKAKVVRI